MDVAFVARFDETVPAKRIEVRGLEGASLWSGHGRKLVVVDTVKLCRDIARVKVKNSTNGGRVFGRDAEV
jgi:hypothetical protein